MTAPATEPDVLKQRVAGAAWAASMLLAIAALALIAFILAIGAAKATPKPSDLHMALNRVVALGGLAAVSAPALASLFNRKWRKAAILSLAGLALILAGLTLVLVAQQG